MDVAVCARRRAWRLDVLWLLAWGIASSGWCLSAAAEQGAVFDEPVYLSRGLEGWRRGSHAPLLEMGTMPLPGDVATLPLYLYERATGTRFDFRAGDCSTPLFWARTTTLLFWWLLLTFALLIGRDLAGPWGGRTAVALLAVDPNFLAHASLATTDIAAAACFLPAVWLFARGREQKAWRRVVVPGVCFGLALFAKASALVFVPVAWLAIELHRWRRDALGGGGEAPRQRLARFTHRFARDAWYAGLVGLAVVFFLCGSDWQSEPSFVRWAEDLPDTPANRAMLAVAENLRIFPNAGSGIVRQIRHNIRGHGSYLLGHMHERSIGWYYPVLYSIKLPAAWLLLIAALAVVRPRALGNWACVAALALGVYCVTCRVQIGIRLMLPWVALGLVGLGAAVVVAWRDLRPMGRRLLLATSGLGVAWTALSAALLWPDGLRYLSEFWGGPEHGYRLVSDSNYDWGQGLRELARWQADHDLREMDLCYVGTDPLLAVVPMRLIGNHTKLTVAELEELVRGRWLAVSATWLYGAYIRDTEIVPYLRRLTPAARTSTFLLFDFTSPGR
jgi:hypothetical protein